MKSIKFKILPIDQPYITAIYQFLNIALQSSQLKVLSLIEWKNRDTIIQLHDVRIGRVIYQDHPSEVTVQFGKILNEKIRRQLPTVLSVESVIEQAPIGIHLIQDFISVALMASSEYYNLPFLLHPLQEGYSIGSDIEPNLEGVPINIDGKLNVWLTFILLKAMNERLIEVQYQGFFVLVVFGDWQRDPLFLLRIFLIYFVKFVLQEHLHRLADVLHDKRVFLMDGSNSLTDIVFVVSHGVRLTANWPGILGF